MTIAFFGHGDAPSEVYPLIEHKITELAEQYDELTCYVGTHGAFDRMAQRALKAALEHYPHIRANIVLAYLPTDKENAEHYKLPTKFPEGIESAHKKWAIEHRNKFMVNECDTVMLRQAQLGGGKICGNGKEEGKGNRKSFGNRCITVQL